MKLLYALAFALSLAGFARADGDTCPLEGFGCDNQCPLAREANQHRALGDEAARVSPVVSRDLALRIQANLARI